MMMMRVGLKRLIELSTNMIRLVSSSASIVLIHVLLNDTGHVMRLFQTGRVQGCWRLEACWVLNALWDW